MLSLRGILIKANKKKWKPLETKYQELELGHDHKKSFSKCWILTTFTDITHIYRDLNTRVTYAHRWNQIINVIKAPRRTILMTKSTQPLNSKYESFYSGYQKLRQQQQPLLAFHSHGWSVHHTRHNQKIPKIIFLPASTGWNHLLDVKWSTTLTCPFILAQKVHFVTKWQQDQHSFFSGDVFKVNVIGL